MNRIFTIAFVMILFTSCKSDMENITLEFQNQKIINSVHNARQLGGYTIGNKQIRKDMLLRTARLSSLSKEDSILLADTYRVQCIYDFRSQQEASTTPDVIPGNSRHMMLSISFDNNETKSEAKASSERETIEMLLKNADNPDVQHLCDHIYDKIFLEESSNEVYRSFFKDLLSVNPEDGAVLWHCTQGKDRAGCASAMILSALGAERELIMADYKLSKEYYESFIAGVKTETENQRKGINTLISANPVIFEKALDKIDERYGSFRNYLTECIGVTPEMMETLRQRYLE